jgi:hypothetical protein
MQVSCRDRFRTTNNMLGDCYAAAIVEKLSKKELMACDAILFQVSNYWHLRFIKSLEFRIFLGV